MSEFWFYHLETASLEAVLPDLLEKTLSKGWTALVKLPEHKLEEFDAFLWTYKDDAFLPHGRDDQPQADEQPVLLTSTATASGAADCVFLLDGTDITVDDKAARCIILIDGQSESSVNKARKKWTELKASGHNISYWQQTSRGGWEKKA